MIDWIAHRGASAEAPENTISAIKQAIMLEVDCIEVDLHLSKDNIPVVLHDSELSRTTNSRDRRCVEDLTLKELKELDAGSWFSPTFVHERIPTLQELLKLERNGIRLMLEIKKGKIPPTNLAQTILKELPANDPSIYLASFEPDIIEAFKGSSYRLMGIVEEPAYIEIFLNAGIKHLALWSAILEPRLIQKLQELGICVWVFTIDEEDRARFLCTQGVNGIITNDPRKFKTCFSESFLNQPKNEKNNGR